MKKRIFVFLYCIVLALCLIGCGKIGRYPNKSEKQLEIIDKTVVQDVTSAQDVYCKGLVGISVVKKNQTIQENGYVSESGYIVTNAHFLADADSLSIQYENGKSTSEVAIAAFDADADIVLLEVKDETIVENAMAIPKSSSKNLLSKDKTGTGYILMRNPDGGRPSAEEVSISSFGSTEGVEYFRVEESFPEEYSGALVIDSTGEIIGQIVLSNEKSDFTCIMAIESIQYISLSLCVQIDNNEYYPAEADKINISVQNMGRILQSLIDLNGYEFKNIYGSSITKKVVEERFCDLLTRNYSGIYLFKETITDRATGEVYDSGNTFRFTQSDSPDYYFTGQLNGKYKTLSGVLALQSYWNGYDTIRFQLVGDGTVLYEHDFVCAVDEEGKSCTKAASYDPIPFKVDVTGVQSVDMKYFLLNDNAFLGNHCTISDLGLVDFVLSN